MVLPSVTHLYDLHGLSVWLSMASKQDMLWLHPSIASKLYTTEESQKYCFVAEGTYKAVYLLTYLLHGAESFLRS